MTESVELTIVMPCLNEAETLETCIKKANSFITGSGIKGEVVIGDNGSTDGSQDIARRNGARVIDIPMKGYGAALRGGIMAAKGKYIIMGDSDDSYDFTNLQPYVDKLREGYDLVMGNRFKGGIEKGAMPFLHYYLGNPVLSFLGRLFFSSNIGDFHCGLRGFSKAAFERMELQTTGMEFATEMVTKASINKMSIAEVPTILRPDGRSRPPHLRTWRDGWRHLRFMLMYSPAWLFLYPGIFLSLVGTIFTALLLMGPVRVGTLAFDVNTLLFTSILAFIGLQFILFFFQTKFYAVNQKLLPETNNMKTLFKYFNLETGLIFSGLLIVSGIVGAFYSVSLWQKTSYGALNPSDSLRVVVPSVFALVVGVQCFLASFFFSILGLRKD